MELILALNLLFIIAYMLILGKMSGGLMKLPKAQKELSRQKVTVIVSLNNEEKNVPGLLEALEKQDFPSEQYEVIFVDDRSTDATGSYLRQACSGRQNYRLITVKETPEGWGPKKYAVTQAVNKAAGDIILLTDADGRPRPGWIRTMLSYFGKNTGMVLGYAPYRKDGDHDTLPNRIMNLEYFSQAAIAAASTGLGAPATCVGTNLAYRRKMFLDLDGYGKFRHTVSGDDDLLLSRVRTETSWDVVYACGEEANVSNEAPKSWRKFYHQRLRFASKGFKYPFAMMTALMIYYFYNVLFLAMFAGLFIYPQYWRVAVIFFVLKAGAESRFMKNAAFIMGETVSALLVYLTSPLHVLYVVYFGAAAQFLSWKWVKNE